VHEHSKFEGGTSEANITASNNDIVNKSSVISLYEFSNDLTGDYLEATPLLDKLEHMRLIISFIASLNDTLVGPFGIGAFELRHIAILKGKWVLIDLGSFESEDIPCDTTIKKERNVYTTRINKRIKPGETCPDSVPCVNNVCKDPYVFANRKRLCNFVLVDLLKSYDMHDRKLCQSLPTHKYLEYLESKVL